MTRAWLAVLTASACTGAVKRPPPPPRPPLYDRLGGMDALTEIAARVVAIATADSRIAKFFAHTDPVVLRDNLARQLCELTGGPCKYTGRDMRSAHAGLAIGEADYTAWMSDVTAALDERTPALATPEKTELIHELDKAKPLIVAP